MFYPFITLICQWSVKANEQKTEKECTFTAQSDIKCDSNAYMLCLSTCKCIFQNFSSIVKKYYKNA